MFQLYKKREFSDYINDTFQFFKITGKHYFKNYFTINGFFLLIAAVLMYFLFKVYFEFIFANINGGVQNNSMFQDLFQNNAGTIMSVAILGMFFFYFLSLLQFAFPVLYLKLYDDKKGAHFETSDIIAELKKSAFKLLKFTIGSIFIIFPIIMIVMFINILLCVIIIGFPLFLITIPMIMSWIHLSFYHYLSSEDTFFGSISAGFGDLKQQFWPIVFSTLIIYIIIQIVNTIFTMIPYVFGMASFYTTLNDSQNATTDRLGFMSIMMTIIMIVSMIVGFILNNLILINQGTIYYSQRDYDENISEKSSIDLIGSDSE